MHKILPLQMDVSWTVCPWLKRRAFFRPGTAGRFAECTVPSGSCGFTKRMTT